MAEPNYVVEAFKLKQNLMFVGVGAAVGLLLGSHFVLGGVAAIEALYLFTASTSPRFQRAIRARMFRP